MFHYVLVVAWTGASTIYEGFNTKQEAVNAYNWALGRPNCNGIETELIQGSFKITCGGLDYDQYGRSFTIAYEEQDAPEYED